MRTMNDIISAMEDSNMDADKVKELRKMTGMSQQSFGDYFGIPRRTVQNWEGDVNECPDYLFALMEYKLINEGIIKAEV